MAELKKALGPDYTAMKSVSGSGVMLDKKEPITCISKPDGYIAVCDDPHHPKGFYFIGAYHEADTAEIAARKGGRVVPFKLLEPK